MPNTRKTIKYSLIIFLLALTKRGSQVDYSIVQAILYSIPKRQINSVHTIFVFPPQQLTVSCDCLNRKLHHRKLSQYAISAVTPHSPCQQPKGTILSKQ